MVIERLKQPEEINEGDFVIIIDEDALHQLFIKKLFVIGKIQKGNIENRDYQLLDIETKQVKIIYDEEVGSEEYWTKREYLNVTKRFNNGREITFELDKGVWDKGYVPDYSNYSFEWLKDLIKGIFDLLKG